MFDFCLENVGLGVGTEGLVLDLFSNMALAAATELTDDLAALSFAELKPFAREAVVHGLETLGDAGDERLSVNGFFQDGLLKGVGDAGAFFSSEGRFDKENVPGDVGELVNLFCPVEGFLRDGALKDLVLEAAFFSNKAIAFETELTGDLCAELSLVLSGAFF